jgi:hypothetical protein
MKEFKASSMETAATRSPFRCKELVKELNVNPVTSDAFWLIGFLGRI